MSSDRIKSPGIISPGMASPGMMTLSEAARATGGQVIGEDVAFLSVGTDSRAIQPQQLFVALRGEKFDGHRFVETALAQGAAAALVAAAVPGETPLLLVDDTRLALGKLASHWRNKFTIPLVAITGSNGKTTVKEMLASILRAACGDDEAVLATRGNLNNDIGMPLTLLGLRSTHRYAVIEMGMNHRGEIDYLSRLARPAVALVNNATPAHLGGLGSVQAIAEAKGEIFSGLAADGVAIINLDDVYAPLWQQLAAAHTQLSFGLDSAADVSARYQLDTDSSQIQISTPQGSLTVRLGVPGVHNVRNALAATAAALAVGVPLTAILAGLEAFAGVRGRLQHKPGLHGAQLIDDTYNANPASMKAAIDVLASRAGKRVLVLGDMGELGETAASLHTEIGRYARDAGIHQLHALGELSQHMVTGFGAGAQHHAQLDSLTAALQNELDAQTTVLIKGSRFMRMERVVEALTTQHNKAQQGEVH